MGDRNLQALGQIDPSVTADVPTFSVYKGAKGKTYAAYNLSDSAKEVTFSDGFKLKVKPKSLGFKTK